MNIVQIKGKPEKIISSLFSESEGGFLDFGFSARSLSPATIEQLEGEEVNFRDYIMEGFVKFTVRVQRLDQALQLNIRCGDENRGRYLISQVEFSVSQVGYEAEVQPNA
ncbi:MAG: hypothetical protein AB2540_12110 [Candidatus Thiodiazotropha endolucinida]